jgi:predicted DNA-binding protein
VSVPIGRQEVERAAKRMSPELEERLRRLADRLHDMAVHVLDLDEAPLAEEIPEALRALEESVIFLEEALNVLDLEIERG